MLNQSTTPPKTNQTTSEQNIHLYIRDRISTFAAGKITPQDILNAEYAIETGDVLYMAEIMMKMAHEPDILAPFIKRIDGLNALPFSIQPPNKPTKREQKQTDVINDIFEHLVNVPQLLLDLCSGIIFGISMLEIADPIEKNNKSGWKRKRLGNIDVWYPVFAYRPLNWFTVNQYNRNEIRLRDNTVEGQELDLQKWVIHRHPTISGLPFENGILRQLIWTYARKEYSEEDWSEALEIFGVSPILGKYKQGASASDISTLQQAVQHLAHKARGVMPDTTDIEIKNTPTWSNSSPFLDHINLGKQTYEELILGFSTADAAKYSGQVGLTIINKATLKREKKDAKFIQHTINNQIITPLMKYNFGVVDEQRMPKFTIDYRPVDISQFGDAILKMMQAGMKIKAEWAYEFANIPQPGEGDEILILQTSKKEEKVEPEPETKPETDSDENPDKTNKQEVADGESFSVALAKKVELVEREDEIDVVSERASMNKELWSSMIAPFLDKINKAESYKDIDLERVLDESSSHVPVTNNLASWYFYQTTQGRLGIEAEEV